MAAIRSKDTKPEILFRKALHARGYRYSIDSKLEAGGRPDIYLKKYNTAVFVHGCFWHGHECPDFRWPATRKEFWREKICGNKVRDQRVESQLANAGFRLLVVWECAICGKRRHSLPKMIDKVEVWLTSKSQRLEISCASEE